MGCFLCIPVVDHEILVSLSFCLLSFGYWLCFEIVEDWDSMEKILHFALHQGSCTFRYFIFERKLNT